MEFIPDYTKIKRKRSKPAHAKTRVKPRHRGGTHAKTKKLNCSPAVSGKTLSSDTCYTDKVLNKVKTAYNVNYPKSPITSYNPKTIFRELKDKLKSCDREDCWLAQLPAKERKYLDKYLFAPDKPKEWKQNPTEWLSNIDILKVLRQYEDKYDNFKFIGPTPIDFDTRLPEKNGVCVWEELCNFSLKRLIRKPVTKIGVIFNLDDHDEPGSHWVSIFIDVEERIILYFDSAANPTPPEIRSLVDRIKTQGRELKEPIEFDYHENYPIAHQEGNTECGMYSLFFIITMLTGKTGFDRKLSMDEKLSLFTKVKVPDKYMKSLRNKYFNG
jgi:hypothetical protein